MLDQELVGQINAFSEWRGTVTGALEYIRARIDDLQKEDKELWEAIVDLRKQLERCRNRCEILSGGKCTKDDISDIKRELDSLWLSFSKFDGKIDEQGKTLNGKICRTDLESVVRRVDAQEKSQIRQAVIMMFYGAIGSGLLAGCLFLLKLLINRG